MTKVQQKTGLPYEDSAIAKYLTQKIDQMAMQKTQREIANEAGYPQPNMLSMMKRGESAVPLKKIPALAKALNVDPIHLFRLAMETYWPDLDVATMSMFRNGLISDNEMEIIKHLRKVTANSDPHLSAENKKAIKEMFEHLKIRD